MEREDDVRDPATTAKDLPTSTGFFHFTLTLFPRISAIVSKSCSSVTIKMRTTKIFVCHDQNRRIARFAQCSPTLLHNPRPRFWCGYSSLLAGTKIRSRKQILCLPFHFQKAEEHKRRDRCSPHQLNMSETFVQMFHRKEWQICPDWLDRVNRQTIIRNITQWRLIPSIATKKILF